MKTETTLTRAEHVLEGALTAIRQIYGLPADDYLTIYSHLVKALTHLKMRQEGFYVEPYLADDVCLPVDERG